MTRSGSHSRAYQPSDKKPSGRSAAHAYLDVACDLVRLPGGAFRVILAFRDWANGGALSMHDDFTIEDQARDSIARAIALFRLRQSPGRDQWRNAPSPSFRRAIGRIAGHSRRGRNQELSAVYERLHWAAGEIVADVSAPENLRTAIIEADRAFWSSTAARLLAPARARIEAAIRDHASDPARPEIHRSVLALRALLGALDEQTTSQASPRKRKRKIMDGGRKR